MAEYVDLSERVSATFYSNEYEEWTQQTVTIADVLDSVCNDYTVLPSAQPDLNQWCVDCKEYDKEKHHCPRFNQVIREALKDAELEPCEDAVSRKDAIRWVKTECNPYGKPTLDFESGKKVIEYLERMSPVTPKRKPGRWNFIGEDMFECTSCGVVYTTNQLNGLRNYDTDPYAPKFCPNCGADMREKYERLD